MNASCAALRRTAGKVSGLTAREADLKAHVAALMALRDAHPALAVGTRTHLHADAQIYVDRKDAGSDRVLFVLNTGTTPAVVTVRAPVLGSPQQLTDLMDSRTVTAGEGGFAIEVPALSGRLLGF